MLNQRLGLFPDYPFQRLRDLLDRHAPGGEGAPIQMSLGEPQHPYPDFVGDVLDAHRDGYGRYPPVAGTPEFLAAVADWLTARYRLPAGLLDPARAVLPLNGTREGLYMLAQLVTPSAKAGTRPAVLIPNPFYQSYVGAALMAGAEAVLLPARRETGFLPDLGRLDSDLLARTALFYLCTPANPQGTVADLDYIGQALDLARRHDFVLAVDECYAEIYDAAPPPGALQAAEGRLDNLVVFHSLSKRSSVPGLRSGFAAGDPVVIDAFRKLRNYGGAPSPLPVYAAAAALWRDERHVEENRSRYRRKFDLAEDVLGGRFSFYRPQGGFFLWLDVGDGERAALSLWRDAGVRVLPGAYLAQPPTENDGFENPGRPYIRVALVGDEATTLEGLQRLSRTL